MGGGRLRRLVGRPELYRFRPEIDRCLAIQNLADPISLLSARASRGHAPLCVQIIAWDELGESDSTAGLQSNFAQPPREGWRVDTRVRTWLRDFVLLDPSDPLTPGLPVTPAQCSSVCSP